MPVSVKMMAQADDQKRRDSNFEEQAGKLAIIATSHQRQVTMLGYNETS